MTSRLILLTDRAQLRLGRGLVRTVAECVGAGLRTVIVREHDLDPAARHALIAALVELPGLTVISSRLPDPAAHALHQPDPAVMRTPEVPTRQRCAGREHRPGRDAQPWGRSCHDAAGVRRAAAEGASYVTLSPFAASASKPGYGPPLPSSEYAGHPVPVYALAGIDAGNAGEALAAGAHGVAVMGGVMRAEDPAAVVAGLLAAIEPEAVR